MLFISGLGTLITIMAYVNDCDNDSPLYLVSDTPRSRADAEKELLEDYELWSQDLVTARQKLSAVASVGLDFVNLSYDEIQAAQEHKFSFFEEESNLIEALMGSGQCASRSQAAFEVSTRDSEARAAIERSSKVLAAHKVAREYIGKNHYAYWEVFEAVYGPHVTVDVRTSEVILEGERLTKPDVLYVKLDRALKRVCQLSTVNRSAYLGAFLDDRRVNPVKELLEDCDRRYPDDHPDWDRLAAILFHNETPLAQAQFSAWLTQYAKRGYDPGCYGKEVLVLAGKQSLGKSPFFSILARMPGEEPMKPSKLYWKQTAKVSEEHAKRQRASKWVVELGELEGITTRMDVEDVKNLFDDPTDSWKVNHVEQTMITPRHYIMGASVNSVNVLKDKTGNERYWMVPVNDVIPLEWLEENLDWIRATAYRKAKAGEATKLSPEMVLESEALNKGYLTGSEVEDDIALVIAKLEQDHESIAIQPKALVPCQPNGTKGLHQIRQTLTNLGFISDSVRCKGVPGTVRVYFRPGVKKPYLVRTEDVEKYLQRLHSLEGEVTVE